MLVKNKIFPNPIFQIVSHFLWKWGIICSHKVIVYRRMGTFWRTDSDLRKVKFIQRMGGDRGFNWGLLPLVIWAFYQDPRTEKAKKDTGNPKQFSSTCLNRYLISLWSSLKFMFTFSVEMCKRPWIVEDSKNSLTISIFTINFSKYNIVQCCDLLLPLVFYLRNCSSISRVCECTATDRKAIAWLHNHPIRTKEIDILRVRRGGGGFLPFYNVEGGNENCLRG